MALSQLLFHAQVRKRTEEIAGNMQTLIIAANNQGGNFPKNAEEGYNAMKGMQQVLPRVFRGAVS
jgi:hypothetical protein